MRHLALLLGGLAVVCGILAVRLWQELRTERLLTAELRSQLLRSMQAGLSVSSTLDQPSTPVMAVGAEGGPAAHTAAAENAAGGPAEPARQPVHLDMRELLKDPEYRAAMRGQLRMLMGQTYPGLAEALGVSQEEADKLLDLLVDMQLERNAGMPPISSDGRPPDRAQIEEMMRQQRQVAQRQDQAIEDLLGPGGLQRFREYEQTRAARIQAQTLQQTLQAANAPLDEAQSKAVTDALIAENRRQQEEMQVLARQFTGAAQTPEERARQQQAAFDMQAEHHRRIVEAVRPYLSARQTETLQAYFEQQLAMNRAMNRLLQQRGNPAGITVGGFTAVTPASSADMTAPAPPP